MRSYLAGRWMKAAATPRAPAPSKVVITPRRRASSQSAAAVRTPSCHRCESAMARARVEPAIAPMTAGPAPSRKDWDGRAGAQALEIRCARDDEQKQWSECQQCGQQPARQAARGVADDGDGLYHRSGGDLAQRNGIEELQVGHPVMVAARGGATPVEVERAERAITCVLRRHGGEGGARVRLTGRRFADGETAQVNVRFRGQPVRTQIAGPGGFALIFAAARLDHDRPHPLVRRTTRWSYPRGSIAIVSASSGGPRGSRSSPSMSARMPRQIRRTPRRNFSSCG